MTRRSRRSSSVSTRATQCASERADCARKRSPTSRLGTTSRRPPVSATMHGHPRSHRLQRDEAERLVDRRHHREVGDPVERVQYVVADPPKERAVLVEPEPAGLGTELRLVGARSGDDEAHVAQPADQAGKRVERELKALLVDQPAHQQDQPLVGRREAGAQCVEIVDGLEVVRIDPVGDHRHALLVEPVDVGDVAAHVVRARDHVVGAPRHPALDGVDVRLRVLVDPALVPSELGGVNRRQVRQARPAGQRVGGLGDQPVVAVDQVDVVDQLDAARDHVGVHPVDPGQERVEVARGRGLAHAMDLDALHDLLDRRRRAAAREDADLDALADEPLGQLADVPRETAGHDRRVLPRKDQDALGHYARRTTS